MKVIFDRMDGAPWILYHDLRSFIVDALYDEWGQTKWEIQFLLDQIDAEVERASREERG